MENRGLSAYTLKMIAIIGMALQHAVIVLGSLIPTPLHFPMQFAGGLTFPIMAFFVVEGYRHTSNLQKYLTRIFIFALIAQIPYMLAFSTAFFIAPIHFNIMFTIFIGLALLVMYDRMKARWLFWILFVLVSIATLLFDWGIIGPIMILMYHAIKSDTGKRIAVPLVAGGFSVVSAILVAVVITAIIVGMAITAGPEAMYEALAGLEDMLDPKAAADLDPAASMASLLFPIGSIATIPLLLMYNGQRGKSMKYLFYIFYPLHLLALALIALALGIGGTLSFSGIF